MKRRWLLLPVAAAYVTGVVLIAGAFNAKQQYDCHVNYPRICDEHRVREDMALAFLFGIFPPFWVMITVDTGVWSYGINYEMRPAFIHGPDKE